MGAAVLVVWEWGRKLDEEESLPADVGLSIPESGLAADSNPVYVMTLLGLGAIPLATDPGLGTRLATE